MLEEDGLEFDAFLKKDDEKVSITLLLNWFFGSRVL